VTERAESNEPRLKVLWVSHTGHPGGAELSLLEAIRALLPYPVDSHVVMPHQGELAGRLAKLGVPTSVVPFTWWVDREQRAAGRLRRSVRHLTAMPRLVGRIRQIRPDVVVTNTLASPAGAIAAAALRIPHVWYIHEYGREDHGLAFDLGERASAAVIRRLSRLVVVNSRAVERRFGGILPSDRLRLVHYAVDVPASRHAPMPVHPPPLRIALVGMKAPGKRQEDVIRAVGMLTSRGIDCRLELIGGEMPEYGEKLRQLVRELKLEDRVEMTAFTDDPLRHVAEAHVGVICSESEAFGRVTVEAMKVGRPMVGAASGGTLDLIQDGVTGFLYPVGDAEALAGRLKMLAEDPALLEEMGRNAVDWARRSFTPEKYGAALHAALREGAGARSPG
jgi:glycosyltransferase involved in cell wall biosynthesis